MKITWSTNMTKVEKDLQKRIPLDYGSNFPDEGLYQLLMDHDVAGNQSDLGEIGESIDGTHDILSYYSFYDDRSGQEYGVYFIHDPSWDYIDPIKTRAEVIDIFLRWYRRRRDAEWEKYYQSGGMEKHLETKRKRQEARRRNLDVAVGLSGLS
jgi:hypothetical protein